MNKMPTTKIQTTKNESSILITISTSMKIPEHSEYIELEKEKFTVDNIKTGISQFTISSN